MGVGKPSASRPRLFNYNFYYYVVFVVVFYYDYYVVFLVLATLKPRTIDIKDIYSMVLT